MACFLSQEVLPGNEVHTSPFCSRCNKSVKTKTRKEKTTLFWVFIEAPRRVDVGVTFNRESR